MSGLTTPASRERSLGGREWIDPVPDTRAQALQEQLRISGGLARILAFRRLLDAQDALRFLNPAEDQLHAPETLLGMTAAVQRLTRAIEGYEKVVVFGDTDVDGLSATTILYSYLKRLGARACYYLPQRLTDGYGFSASTVSNLHATGAELVVTVDHGSTELAGPRLLRALGMDLIITDHHQLGPVRPDAVALVNPQQPECPYPFKGLSASGVAFKLVCALDTQLTQTDFWSRHGIARISPGYYLDLVALATVADMSPLVGENRILVKLGLEAINSHPRPGLAGLIKECHIQPPVTASVITFKLAPKINALGRIGDPRIGLQLLTSRSYTEARRLARRMVDMNRQRQEVERQAYSSALPQAEAQADRPVLVLVGGDWHPGIVGSIASRVAFQTGKPTVALTLSQAPQVLGSARGGPYYNILAALDACAPLLIRYGGHPQACGLALDPANLNDFIQRLLTAVEANCGEHCPPAKRPLEIETWIDADQLTGDFVEELALLSPFGHCNPEPVVAVRGLEVAAPCIIHNRHLRFDLLCPNGLKLEGFAWDHSEWDVQNSTRYDIAFMPQTPESRRTPQVKVLDLKASE